jgi:hypothetical protein
LFGLKAWLHEPWLLEWLAKEGISVADFLPEAVVEWSPPSKRVRQSGRASFTDYQALLRGSSVGSASEELEFGEGMGDALLEEEGEGEADGPCDAEGRGTLDLLLEAVDEMDKQQDPSVGLR